MQVDSQNNFSCVTEVENQIQRKKKRESDDYKENDPWVVTDFVSYNILTDENEHWPDCGESLTAKELLGDVLRTSESASCIDIFKNTYHIFSCNRAMDSEDDLVNIYSLRKCCPKYFSYDVFMRRCVANNESIIEDDFGEILTKRNVPFTTGIPHCHDDDVIIEYHSDVHKFRLYDNSLIITGLGGYGPSILPQNSFCIERTMNSDADTPDGDNPEHHNLKKSSRWIAKSCRNKTICESVPCVRKCCKEGQRMVLENETFCEEHDTHLDIKFHNFDIKSVYEEPAPLEPSGEL